MGGCLFAAQYGHLKNTDRKRKAPPTVIHANSNAPRDLFSEEPSHAVEMKHKIFITYVWAQIPNRIPNAQFDSTLRYPSFLEAAAHN